MNLASKFKQTAVLWTKANVKGSGYTSYVPGVEISVRWQAKRELFINQAGEDQFSRAIVYMIGTQSISVDDKLYLGELTDLSAEEKANPALLTTAYRVEAVDDSPSLRADQTLRKVTL